MNNNNRELLKSIFEKNGIVIIDEDFDLSNEIDSLQFICLLVDIEKNFSIEIPYEFLTQSIMISFSDFIKIIDGAMQS